jgi:hypothetical protein
MSYAGIEVCVLLLVESGSLWSDIAALVYNSY